MYYRSFVDNVNIDALFSSNLDIILSEWIASRHASMCDICSCRMGRFPFTTNSNNFLVMVYWNSFMDKSLFQKLIGLLVLVIHVVNSLYQWWHVEMILYHLFLVELVHSIFWIRVCLCCYGCNMLDDIFWHDSANMIHSIHEVFGIISGGKHYRW